MKNNYKPHINDIFVSTVTNNLIDSCNIFSKKFNKRIVLIASLNQVSLYKNSYLYNDISKLKNQISKYQNKNIFLGRDHFGTNSINNFKISNKNNFLKKNLIYDLKNNLNFIHLDFVNDIKYIQNLRKYMDIILSINQKLTIEIGLDLDGAKTKINTFKELINLSSLYKENIKFITYQTGTKLFNNSNKSKVNYKNIKNITFIQKNIFFKEHNCDFKNKNHFKKLKNINFVFNIGPEFAYYENKLFCQMIEKYSKNSEYERLYNYVLKNNLWRKWCTSKLTNKEKILSSLHYFYNKKIFKDLKNKLNSKIDFDKAIIDQNIKLMKSKFIF
tara:strand:+ start:78 stop:1067 length:990 start_codon:yes stop_codon:yes gene_type:complete